jgi:hypothetical protein
MADRIFATLAIAMLVALGFFVGVHVGMTSQRDHILKTYEDGSFVGCYKGAQCND